MDEANEHHEDTLPHRLLEAGIWAIIPAAVAAGALAFFQRPPWIVVTISVVIAVVIFAISLIHQRYTATRRPRQEPTPAAEPRRGRRFRE